MRRTVVGALFALLLLVVASVPALAAEEQTMKAVSGRSTWAPKPNAKNVDLPDAEDIREAREDDERKEAERERWLLSPEAVKKRAASRTAYLGLSAEEARQSIFQVFSDQLAMLNADPARALSDAELIRAHGRSAATIREAGETSLLDSTVPVRVPNDQGELHKVDLSLERSDAGFAPESALADLRIPVTAGGKIRIGRQGLAISADGVEAERPGQTLGDKNVYYHEVLPSTGLMVSPITEGVEIFNVLFSEQSPEVLSYDLDLPKGAELRSDGRGGAEVMVGEETTAVIPAPVAVDAQGTRVPVEMRVEDGALTLLAPHVEGDYAYPILVDPVILENYQASWYWGDVSSLGAWFPSTNDPTGNWILYSTWCITTELCTPSQRGLFLISLPSVLPPGLYTQWVYYVPNYTTYIPSVYPDVSAILHPLNRWNHNCQNIQQYPQTYDYVGAFDAAGNWTWYEPNRAQYYGYSYMYTVAKGVTFGLSASASSNMPCWRSLMLGGSAIRLSDPEAASVTSVTGVPSGWFGPESGEKTITINSYDPGLGVQFVTLSQEGGGVIAQDQVGCQGTAAYPCPVGRATNVKLSALSLWDGIRTLSVGAQDPLGQASGHQFQIKVDRSKPEVTLGGQLARVTKENEGETEGDKAVEKLSLPVYNLTVDAVDGNPQADHRYFESGVKDVEVYLDGIEKQVPWSAQPCVGPNYSCPMEVVYPLELTDLELGEHKLKVIVEDHVGNEREREIEFEYIPATGMKDEYVLHYFPLPDGSDEEEKEHPRRPELAVNVMNGNLVYRQKDVEVPTASVDLEVERFYNSQLPDAESGEWGQGWTLGETPELHPEESPAPSEAALTDSSGSLEEEVELPTQSGAQSFDAALQATITKKPGGGYTLTDETGESPTSVEFNAAGRTEALQTEGYASVDYRYESGVLDEIAIEDPGSAGRPTEEPEEAEGEGAPLPPSPTPAYQATFGSNGGSDGQLDTPADLALDPEGDIWVVDKLNKRVQQFSPDGDFLSKIGSAGAGNGQFERPASIAIDAAGNILVADVDNHRVQRFDDEGNFLSGFGSFGTSDGELDSPEGIAIDDEGNVWIADTATGRLQKFDPEGEFIEAVGSKGAGEGQLEEPTGIDVGPEGNVWVADWANDRVSVFEPDAGFAFQFGVQGSGPGQFEGPDAVDVDEQGNVWVVDQGNDRVQRFDVGGGYVDEFGSSGSGEAQFDLARSAGIFTTDGGDVWITDSSNHRVQKWQAPGLQEAGAPAPDDDPEIEVETEGGLVESLDGEEAGQHAYEYSGDDLVSHDGPEGETTYEYDGAGRMTKVTLPNGTWGAIAYEGRGRVASVTVNPVGEAPAKTTEFEYTDASGSEEARRTTVYLPDDPHVVYDIGADGSVFKWHNVDQPPELDLAGTLYDNREENGALFAGDHLLEAEAYSPEGMASIEVVVNGTVLVDEMHCDQDPQQEGLECVNPPLLNQWVMETAANAPGHLYVEVIATNRLNRSTSERFWVDIPQPPPPLAQGTPVPPKFYEIKRFREEYGLEVVFPVANEIELNERIFDLITAWWTPWTPAGEVAQASYERWGVPLRPADVAEMEYREEYMALNIPQIEAWASQNLSSTYAGYYVDHAAGGIMRIGFTQDQQGALAQLKQQPGMVAIDRLGTFPTTPTSARISLRTTLDQVEAAWESDPLLASLVTGTGMDERSNAVEVTGSDPAQIEARLQLLLGSGAPVRGVYEAMGEEFKPRDRVDGRIQAGHRIVSSTGCTAGFGAWDRIGTKPNGEAKIAPFVLTAAHCGVIGTVFERGESNAKGDIFESTLKKVGHLGRTAFVNGGAPFETDAALVKLNAGGLMPRYIYKDVGSQKPVEEAGRPWPGETLCFSAPGVEVTKHPCGQFVGARVRKTPGGKRYVLIARFIGMPGDSGGPVWSPRLQRSVGIIFGGPNDGRYQSWATPLLVPRNHADRAAKVPGVLNAPGLGTFHLAVPGS